VVEVPEAADFPEADLVEAEVGAGDKKRVRGVKDSRGQGVQANSIKESKFQRL
jgi:hypothetical protein